jgi:hypothetical protein
LRAAFWLMAMLLHSGLGCKQGYSRAGLALQFMKCTGTEAVPVRGPDYGNSLTIPVSYIA